MPKKDLENSIGLSRAPGVTYEAKPEYFSVTKMSNVLHSKTKKYAQTVNEI